MLCWVLPVTSAIIGNSVVSERNLPVFFDPSHKRRVWFKRFVRFALLLLVLIFTVQFIRLLLPAPLPVLPVTDAEMYARSQTPVAQAVPLKDPKAEDREDWADLRPRIFAVYADYNPGTVASIRKNVNTMDRLIAGSIGLAEGGLVIQGNAIADVATYEIARAGRADIPILALFRANDPQTGEWRPDRLQQMLESSELRARSIAGLQNFVRTWNLKGVALDFYNVPRIYRHLVTSYVCDLFQRFSAQGIEIVHVVPAEDPAYDYPKLSKCVNYFMLPLFHRYPAAAISPPAPQKWVTQLIKDFFAQVDRRQVVLALGSLGYNWAEAAAYPNWYSFDDLMELARKSRAKITLDPESLNPTFKYHDDQGIPHTVWFLDGVTAFNQVAAGAAYTPRGWSLWSYGFEDPGIWTVLVNRERPSFDVYDSLRAIRTTFEVENNREETGGGQILRVVAQPTQGVRKIVYHAQSNRIVGGEYTDIIAPVLVTRTGSSDIKVALTFDDGPDPLYTPQILDVLRDHDVPATFFLIGMNANSNPDIVRRMVEEGHLVGNHTLTHPAIEKLPPVQVTLEVNGAQRIFEEIIGRRTLFFRSPYVVYTNPHDLDMDHLMAMSQTTEMGYYNVLSDADPIDWKMDQSAEGIAQRAIDLVTKKGGRIVLLHDAGGDRSNTVAALPLIITTLRAQGYEFVPVSSLINLTLDQAMPRLQQGEVVEATFANMSFVVLRSLGYVLTVALIGVVISGSRQILISTLAVIHAKRSRAKRHPTLEEYCPTVSVIVPAYNEERVIVRTVETILKSDYPNFDIIVVDDGSADQTYQRVVEAFSDNPRVRPFKIPNGGKSNAINYGVSQSQAEVIAALDADTLLDPQAIRLMVRHFADKRVGAVAGNAKVGNRKNFITRWQALEYITSQNMDRRAFALLNCITVVPGAIGAWRREAMIRLGGVPKNTLAEDCDLTICMLRAGYRIPYEENAMAYTEAPENFKAFMKQRFRWMFGTLQVIRKHQRVLFSPWRPALGFLALPNVLIFQILIPVIAPIMDLMLVFTLVRYLLPTNYDSQGISTYYLQQIAAYYGVFFAMDLLAVLLAFSLERREDRRLIRQLFWQRLFYRQIMYYISIKSVVTAIRGSMVGWNKLERRGIDENLVKSKLNAAAPTAQAQTQPKP